MMYLSLLTLNPRARRVQRELADCYQLHRTVMAGFPPVLPAEERVLYRLEPGSREAPPRLLVQSLTPPDWTKLAEGEGEPYLLPGLAPNPAVKEFSLRLRAGQELLFRLVANPTARRGPLSDKGERARVGLLREEEQLAWLARKGETAGFRLLEARVSGSRRSQGWRPEESGRRALAIVAVQFDGLLRVHDPEALAQSVARGIGAAKGFGCGLLSLARPS